MVEAASIEVKNNYC